jgi:hypothetical protein
MQLVRLPQGLTAAQEPQPSAGRVFSAGAPRTVEGVRSRSRSGLMRSSERLNAFSIRLGGSLRASAVAPWLGTGALFALRYARQATRVAMEHPVPKTRHLLPKTGRTSSAAVTLSSSGAASSPMRSPAPRNGEAGMRTCGRRRC